MWLGQFGIVVTGPFYIARDGERVRQPDRTDVDSWRRTGPIDLPEAPRREFREGGRGGFGGRGGRGDTSWGHSGRDSFGSRGKFGFKH